MAKLQFYKEKTASLIFFILVTGQFYNSGHTSHLTNSTGYKESHGSFLFGYFMYSMGTVTPVFQAIMVTLGMDSVSPVSVTCMGQGIQSVIQEQGNACVRKSMLGGLVGNARMDLVQ